MNQTYLSLSTEQCAIYIIQLQQPLRAYFCKRSCHKCEMIAGYLLVALLPGLSLSDKFSLPDDYSVEVLPPTEDDSPVELLASVNLRNILDVLETKQQIREGGGR